ncbi:MAG: GNAT family N-acetyltransferase [Sphingomonadaceae bacterium]
MRIRTAMRDELVPLHALIERAYRGDSARAGWTHEADLLGGQRTDPEALAAIFADPRQRVLVADIDGEMRGCVNVQDKDAGLAYLGLLTVDPAHQARGTGAALLAAAEAFARSVFGATVMEMTVIAQRPELVDYYVRKGYAQSGETRPFPHADPRFGLPTRRDLHFVVLNRDIALL